MLAYLQGVFAPPPGTPSLLVVVGTFGYRLDILHLLPEDGSIERFGCSSHSPTFQYRGASEEAREQIGTVTINAGDGEGTNTFLDDVMMAIRERWKAGSVGMTELIHNVLRPAVLGAIQKREGRPRSMNATQTHDVYILQITRKHASLVPTNPTSFPG